MTSKEAEKTRKHGTDGGRSERGSALVVAILVMVILSLMGLAFALVAESENRISLNHRHQAQALYVAEGTVRVVKGWFDDPDPTTSFRIPTASQVNRSLRHVDHDGDGTFQLYSTAPSPWNVIYRSGTNDLFEKPYRGGPQFSLEGTQTNPDVRISDTGSAAEQAYLASLNNALYPNFPGPTLRARVRQIDVFSPPILRIGTQRIRYGIGTVMVTAAVFEHAGTASERQVGERVVKAVLNEIFFPGPTGPLTSCRSMNSKGQFNVHWGIVGSVLYADIPSNIDSKLNSGVPWWNIDKMFGLDNNGDGTVDDFNANGQADFNEWFMNSDNTIEDPWLKMYCGDTWSGGGTDDGSQNGQPWKFGPVRPPSPPGTAVDVDREHSNVFIRVSRPICPDFDYNKWKEIARSGGANIYYYTYHAPTGLFRENGTGAPTSLQNATQGRSGLFFFDTVDGQAPRDLDGNGKSDNLTPAIHISGSSWWSGGIIYLNSVAFKTSGLTAVPNRKIKAPGEPYIDANNNGMLDSNEWFLNLQYPAQYIGNYYYTKMNWTTPATAPGGVVWDSAGPEKNENIHFYGVIYNTGEWTASGNGNYFGAIVAKEGVGEDSGSTTGSWEIFFDESLIKDGWPPKFLKIARTYVTIWETDM